MSNQLRHDLARSIALFAVIVVAASSFALLSGASETSRLQSTNTVSTAFRPAYDLLVRPHGAQGSNQGGGALVPPDSLASQYGGITLDQWKSVLGVPGVEVAAPVAMVGYGMTNLSVPVDVSGYLPAGGRQVLRLEATWVADHGLTAAPEPRRYFYSTSEPLDALPAAPGVSPNAGAIEKLPDGSSRQVCMVPTVINRGQSGTGTPRGELLRCWSSTGSAATGSAQWVYGWIYPYLIAAIDPVQEAKLAGLDRAVITGRYLGDGDAPSAVPAEAGGAPGYAEVPVLVARNPQVDQDLKVAISRLDSEAAGQVLTTPGRDDLLNAWQAASGTPVGTQSLPGDVAYQALVNSLTEDGRTSARRLFEYYTVGPVTYSADDQGTLTPKTVGMGASVAWHPNSKDVIEGTVGKPAVADDTAFRSLTAHRSRQQDDTQQLGSVVFKVIGQYDRTQLPTWNDLSRVSMDMYYSPTAQGADQRSRDLVGEDGLLPSANIGGLLTAPATMLTTLDALSALQDPMRYTGIEDAARAAPISVVRVRLSGNLGIDDVSRERIRLVAQEITRRTGLDVDIMVGSSPSAVTVAAPAGKLGRPDLALSQDWARKGVATIIISAIDKKSLVIFLLILVVAALAVGNATAAAVRTRRTELAVLACTGWRQSALVKLILAETAVVGLLGSVAGVALAVPVAAVEGIAINPWWMVATVPCALAMVLGAAAVPAMRAGRADPGAAVRPAVSPPRRGWPSRTVASTALSYLLRLPGRTLIGAASLAVGVAALAILLMVTVAFHGAVAGSLLGEAVSVEARLADYLGVGIIVILGAFSVADVLYLNVRDTRGELAALAASGWTDTTLARLVIYQGLGIGLLGAALGVAGGVTAASLLVGETTLVMAGVSGLVGVVGIAVTAAAAVLPLLALRRLPLADVLSEG